MVDKADYNASVYMEQGGDRLVFKTDGSLQVSDVDVSRTSLYVTLFDYSFAVSGDPATLDISTNLVPAGAKVLGGWYEVDTTFTSSTDTASIALSLVAADDLVTAVAIATAGDVWDAGSRVYFGPIATTLVAAKRIAMDGAISAVTAGILHGLGEWIIPANDSTGH